MKEKIDDTLLGSIKGPYTVVPTIEELTNFKSLILVLDDDSVQEFLNENCLTFEGQHKSMDAFMPFVGLRPEELDEIYWKDPELLKAIQIKLPQVKGLYIGEL